MRTLARLLFALAPALACCTGLAVAQTPVKDSDHPALPGVQGVENPAEAAQRLAIAPGLRADLWAAEPDLQNPVSFSFDERGRCYVAETFRRRTSTLDIRQHMQWLEESLAMRTVEDRLAFLQRAFLDQKAAPYLGIIDRNHDGRLDWRDLAVESERIVLLEDRAGAGRADHAATFAEGFNTAVTGLGAGVLAHAGQVYFTCLPDLWKMPANHPAGRKALLSGFGVHITYSGHDLHGLALGCDGKLYWTLGDCGAHVVTKEGGVLDVPDTGAVFRANLDGTEAEVVMRGLRNPEELCFNDFGDLFTADNNADQGDPARWVQVVEGGDAGWQIGWQALPGLGAWNDEKLWSQDTAENALAILPPVGALGHGPAGIASYPGTGLPEAWKGCFFVCDFPGGVRSFSLLPRGAGYALDASAAVLQDNSYGLEHKLAWGFFPTDVDFGVDGGVYVLDWVQDVEKPGKGRIFRLHAPATDASEVVRETRALLGQDLRLRPAAELAGLLGHPDRRVRQAAQFALADQGAVEALAKTADHGPQLARLHAIWGLGQIGRRTPGALTPLRLLLRDSDSEVRTQAARSLAGDRSPETSSLLVGALADEAPRVRAAAALALSRQPDATAVPALLAMLRANQFEDAIVRHAGVMALAACAGESDLDRPSGDSEEAVRAAVLLTFRRQKRPEVARFLHDRSPRIVLEAARAIYDTPIEKALPALASLLQSADLAAPLLARVLEANYALGDAASAGRLAALANSEAPDGIRARAVEALGQWNATHGRDRFLGLWRPPSPTRDSQAATAALLPIFSSLLGPKAGPRVQLATIAAVAQLRLTAAETALASLAAEKSAASDQRVAALRSLAAMASPRVATLLTAALQDSDASVRACALDLEKRLSPQNAVSAAAHALATGNTAEKQNALHALADVKGPEAEKEIAKWLERYLLGQVPPALHLDLFDAAEEHDTPALHKVMARVALTRGQGRLAPWRECLEGGDPGRGRQIFCERAEAGCLRCHKVRGLGGEVGPDLSTVGARHDRVFILRSILFPNEVIAPGYENLAITGRDGRQIIGLAVHEDRETLTIKDLAGGKTAVVVKSEITRREALPSAMPEGLGQVLGKRDLRDVVAFLASLR